MTSLASKFSRLAQALLIVSMLILTFGFAHLLSYGGEPSSMVINWYLPFVYAFEITISVSIILAIVAIVLNFRARPK